MDRDEFTRRILAMRLTLYRVSYGILASESEREDAVQNAVMKAWQKHGQLRDERLMETWLVRILINECYNVKRADRRISPMAELPSVPLRLTRAAKCAARCWLCLTNCACRWCCIIWKAIAWMKSRVCCTCRRARSNRA